MWFLALHDGNLVGKLSEAYLEAISVVKFTSQ